jgi:Ca2+-binding RTX toxin-like protein
MSVTVIVNGFQTTPAGSGDDNATLVVTGTGIIAYDGDPAIFMSGDNQRTTVLGEVYSSTGRAILSQGKNAKVFIGASAEISGTTGVQTGDNGFVQNSGTIEGSIDLPSGTLINTGSIFGFIEIFFGGSLRNYGNLIGGLTVETRDLQQDFPVYNSGHMQNFDSRAFTTTVENDGFIDNYYTENVLSLTNSGTIRNFRVDGAATIINRGLITGDGIASGNLIFLSDANDSYDGRSGAITGTIIAGGGTDTLIGGAQSDNFDGSDRGAPGGGDKLYGNGGDDTLTGDTGDLLVGGAGDDTFIISTGGVTIKEAAGGGTDTVQSGIDYRLVANVENLVLTGIKGINGTGNTLANEITGNSAANVLDGRAGADTMKGGAGNDTYIVDNRGDVVVELAGQGHDLVKSSVGYTLSANVEDLQLTGAAAINGSGNTLGNAITGNQAANVLDGGTGKDRLQGNGGADAFVFDSKLGAANVDQIVDFSAKADSFRLNHTIFNALSKGALPAAAFKDISKGPVDISDRILYDHATGKLFYDPDGSGLGSSAQFAVLDNRAVISAADFLVV